jgi:hypothetical protein
MKLTSWLDLFSNALAEKGIESQFGLSSSVGGGVLNLYESDLPPIAKEGITLPYQEATKSGYPETMSIGLEHHLLPVKKPGTNDYKPVQDLIVITK